MDVLTVSRTTATATVGMLLIEHQLAVTEEDQVAGIHKDGSLYQDRRPPIFSSYRFVVTLFATYYIITKLLRFLILLFNFYTINIKRNGIRWRYICKMSIYI